MRIGIVLSSPPGYSETFFRSKIKGLQEKGHQVLLVTAATKEKFNGCEHRFHPTVSKTLGYRCSVFYGWVLPFFLL